MFYSAALLIAARLVIPCLTTPTQPPLTLKHLEHRQDSNSTNGGSSAFSSGVPFDGVNCSSVNEPNHYLSWTLISQTISNVYLHNNTYSNIPTAYPGIYSDLQRAPDSKIVWAPGCGWNVVGAVAPATMFFQPILYDGLTAPAYNSSGALEPGSSPDVVVFSMIPGIGDGYYCAVLTNSDASAKGLHPMNGYHQCNDNTSEQEGGEGVPTVYPAGT